MQKTLEDRLMDLMAEGGYEGVRNVKARNELRGGLFDTMEVLVDDERGLVLADHVREGRKSVIWVFSTEGNAFSVNGRKIPKRTADSPPEQEKSLLAAMAIKRWARSGPGVTIGDGEYISSKDIEAALLGDGLKINTVYDIARDGYERINAVKGSVGFDACLEITKLGENQYLVRIPGTMAAG